MVDASIRQTFLDIASNEHAIPEDVDPAEFVYSSIPLLGESDGEFRERNVYGTLHRWIVSEAIDAQGLRDIHLGLLGENALFSGIGENGSDSVFLRAFVALLLVPTLYMHRKQAFLSSEEVEQTCNDLARYLREEKDLRGYISGEKWWAHGIAHAADAVGQLVQCSELGSEPIVQLLEAIAGAMTPDTVVYAHEEDARMAAAVLKLLKRDVLSQEIIENWLKHVVPKARFEGQLPNVHIQYVNARNSLRCLLFQAKGELADGVISLIEAAHAALPDR
ncbi:DUF2785 domain-containing protein [Candidatus Bipolaricaulota bacterium]|nr:DUF2785 domain-containing protein [Candidatus Bipolaricaulota bacterium]